MVDGDDIAARPVAVALQEAIAAAPEDAATQLVLADLLLDAGDPRGEVIALDRRERELPGGIDDPELLERYLLLVADYGFPCAEREPPHGFAPAPRGLYVLRSAGHLYEVRFRDRIAQLMAQHLPGGEWVRANEGPWEPDEIEAVLRLFADAIRASTPLGRLQLPFTRDALPYYPGALPRGYAVPRAMIRRYKVSRQRFGLVPRDYYRWMKRWERFMWMLRPKK